MKKLNSAQMHSVTGGNIIDKYIYDDQISQYCADLFLNLLPGAFDGTMPLAVAAQQIIDAGCHVDYLRIYSNAKKPGIPGMCV